MLTVLLNKYNCIRSNFHILTVLSCQVGMPRGLACSVDVAYVLLRSSYVPHFHLGITACRQEPTLTLMDLITWCHWCSCFTCLGSKPKVITVSIFIYNQYDSGPQPICSPPVFPPPPPPPPPSPRSQGLEKCRHAEDSLHLSPHLLSLWGDVLPQAFSPDSDRGHWSPVLPGWRCPPLLSALPCYTVGEETSFLYLFQRYWCGSFWGQQGGQWPHAKPFARARDPHRSPSTLRCHTLLQWPSSWQDGPDPSLLTFCQGTNQVLE